MAHDQLLKFLEQTGKDPTRLIFEDELTSLYNRRFLLSYFEYQVSWEEVESSPLSLLMVDIDHFKQINDQHGHEAGDQALQQLAALIKEVAEGQGLAIRYAGDEFVLLLPKCGKRSACDVAERLLRRVQETPFKVDHAEHGIRLTLSIGVATTPEDARTRKTLLQRADTALYHVKKSGRNGVADAAALDPSKVFDVAALHKLEGATIAGRGVQLVQVAESFEKFRQGQNQFLLVRGAAGMGKSTLLDTVRRNLSQGDPCMVKVSGLSQELYRPYYLTTKILGSLLSQSPNQGADMIKTLD
ncbi:MAG: diguanylate cyclase, partial [Nitrospirales bacterium]